MQINLTQCRAHQTNSLTYCWVFWFHWFRSGQCYCLLLFVSSMLLFVWFLKWRMYLCGTVFILLKCTWRSNSLDKQCLGHTDPNFCHIYTHTVSLKENPTSSFFIPPSLPSGFRREWVSLQDVFSVLLKRNAPFPFQVNAQALTGNICVIGVLSVRHGATGAAAAENTKNTEASQRMMFDSRKGSVTVYFWNVEHVLLWQRKSLESSFMLEWVL